MNTLSYTAFKVTMESTVNNVLETHQPVIVKKKIDTHPLSSCRSKIISLWLKRDTC